MKKFLAIACLSMGLAACSSDDNKQSKEFEIVTLEINTIAYDNILYNDINTAGEIENESRLILDAMDWQNLIDQINSYEQDLGRLATILINTPIDFQQEEVLAVFEEVKMNGGHSIDITNVEEHEKEVLVTVQRLHRGNLTSVITQPFHIVKIPKIDKPVVFVEVE